MSTIALTLDDCIAIAAARNEPLETTIRRINKLDSYESKPTIGKGPKAPAKPKAVKKPATKKPTIAKASKPKAVKADPKVGTGSAMAENWAGQSMKADKGTASSGQVKWLVSQGMKPAAAKKLSMVEASNQRAKLTGKIA